MLHFKSKALQTHNNHSPSQRFEHRVTESSQRQLESESVSLCPCALMFVTVCYFLSVSVYELVCACACEWILSHKGNMSQQIGRGFVVSYHPSPALKKIISSDQLHKLSFQSEIHATYCSSVKINATPFSELCHSKCYFTQATTFAHSSPWIKSLNNAWLLDVYSPVFLSSVTRCFKWNRTTSIITH